VCQEKYPGGIRFAQEVEVNTSELFYEVRLKNGMGKWTPNSHCMHASYTVMLLQHLLYSGI